MAAEPNERGGKKQEVKELAPLNYGVALTRNEEKSAGNKGCDHS